MGDHQVTLDDLLDKLVDVRPAGNGFVAVCPGHDDSEASLGVTEGDDGRILLRCHAGCETRHIVTAMGLQLRDLFPERQNAHPDPDAVYEYHAEDGSVLYQVLRFNQGDGKKRFQQRHHDPENPDAKSDGWVWNMEGVRKVLYHLPEVIEGVENGRMIYLVEGEKDVDRIRTETNRVATTALGGAGKWRPEYTEFFRGARVTVIQDKDEPGKRFASKIVEALTGVAESVVLLQSRVGKDVSDMFDAGLKMEDGGLIPPRSTPKRGIVTMAELVEQGHDYLHLRVTDLPGYALINGVEASIVRPGRLYSGGAYTGDGKTTLALQGSRNIASQRVPMGYFSMEMSERDLRNRLIAHKGVPLRLLEQPWLLRQDPQMLGLYNMALDEMAEWKLEIIYDTTLTADKVVQETLDREYEFIVIDHIHRFGRKGRDHLEEEIMKLTNLSLDINIPILVLCQLRKFSRGPNMVAYPPPTLHDFRETSVLGDEASIAFAIWRSRDDEGMAYKGDTSQFRVLKNRHTTSHNDQAGHIDLLAFDRTTQLYSTGGTSHDAGHVQPQGQVSADSQGVVVDWGE